MPHAGTSYDPAMIEKAEAYLADYSPEKFPTLAGMSLRMGIYSERLGDWEPKHPELARVIKKCKLLQEQILATAMFNKETFTPGQIFLAKNVLGWADKLETENTNHDSAQSLQAARAKVHKLRTVKSGKAKKSTDSTEAA